MLNTLFKFALLLTASPALAFGGPPKHSAVAVEARAGDGAQQFTFKVEPKNDMIVNFDAPWKLEVKGHDGLTLPKTTFARGDLDEKLPGYVVSAKAGKPQGDLEYSLTAFICTKDKTQCFREVHTGKTTWAAK